MANFTSIPPEEFCKDITMLESTDPNSNIVFNNLIQELINNDLFMNELLNKLVKKANTMESSISSLQTAVTNIPNEYLSTNGGKVSGYLEAEKLISKITNGVSHSEIYIIPHVPYELIEPAHDTQVYLKELTKWICSNYPNTNMGIFIGLAHPNSAGFVIMNIYDTSTIKNNCPEYASGLYLDLGGNINIFTYRSYTWGFRSL